MSNDKDNNFFKDKKILVTGGSGFIGTNLIKKLAELDADITATYHNTGPILKGTKEEIKYIKCNLLNIDDCKAITTDIEYVFMCAASTSGAAIITSNPLIHVTPNIIMNSQMLEASYLNQIDKFIFISSNAAYPPSDIPIKEEYMFDGDPYDSYYGVGWMKRYTEILCKLYSQKLKNPIKSVVVRPSNIYGPYDKFDLATSHVMAATLRKVIERHDPIKVWGTGDDIRDLIYIDDFIDALILASKKLTNDVVNIGYGEAYSIKQILKIALEVDGYKDANIIYDNSKPSTIPKRLIDISKSERLLGYKPKTDIIQGIKKTIDWYKSNQANNN